jgi:hypothetical protein
MPGRAHADAPSESRTTGLGIVVAVLLVLAPAAARVVFAQDAPPVLPPDAPPVGGGGGGGFRFPWSLEELSESIWRGLVWFLEQGAGMRALQAASRLAGEVGVSWLREADSGAGQLAVATQFNLAVLEWGPVREKWAYLRALLVAGIGAVVAVTGFQVAGRAGGLTLSEGMLVLPRAALGVLAAQLSLDFVRWAFQGVNAVAAGLVGGSLRFAAEADPSQAGMVLLVVGALAFLVVVERIVMHGLLIGLAVAAPLAILGWIAPGFPIGGAVLTWWLRFFRALAIGTVAQAFFLSIGAALLAPLGQSGGVAESGLWQPAVGGAMFALALAAPLWFGGPGGSWTLAQAHRAALLATRATMVGRAAGEAAGGALSAWAGPQSGRPRWDVRTEPRGGGGGGGGSGGGAPLARRESEVIDVDARDVTVTTAPLLPRPRAGLPRPGPQLPDREV